MAKPKTKRKAKRRDERVLYLIEIEGWDWGYSFGVNETKHFDDPYMEFRHLHIHGQPLRPLDTKAERVELVLLPDKRLNEEGRQRNKPQAVGSLSLRKEVLEALLSIPADTLTPVLQDLTAGKLRYATLDATRLRYRQGLVRDLSLAEGYDEEDWPEES